MKFLHTMIRVGNLERAIKFYTENFGMKLIRQKDYPGGKFTLAFIGYGDEADNTVIELTHNWETESYDIGDGFGHFALGVEDIYAVCDKLRDDGVIITREPGPMKHGTTLIAFVKDPDGYSIELIERKSL
jgi:lactoylglutathione lyase